MFVRVEHAAAAAVSLVGPLVKSDQLRGGGVVVRVEGELVAWPTGAPQNIATNHEECCLVESEGAPAAGAREDVLWYSA